MKKILILIVVIIVGVVTYFITTPSSNSNKKVEKEIESESKNLVVDTKIKAQLQVKKDSKKSNSNEIVKKTDTKEKVEIKTDSTVLRDLYLSLVKGDRKLFTNLYNTKVKELRDKDRDRDNSLFYQQFKALFLENDIDNSDKVALLGLLGRAGTKESLSLLFEMTEDGTFDSSDLELMGGIANDIIKRSADDIKDGGGWDALIAGYKNSSNRWVMSAAAYALSIHESDDTLEMFITDYAHTDDEARKWAAEVGLERATTTTKDSLTMLRNFLDSSDTKMRDASALTLSYIAVNESSEVLQEWIMDKATMDDIDNIKKWYKNLMTGTDPYVISKNIVIEKIRDKQLQDELKLFIEEEIESYEKRMIEVEKSYRDSAN